MKVLRTAIIGSGSEERELKLIADIEATWYRQSGADAAIEMLEPFNPTRTGAPGVYGYDSPTHGRGVLTLQDAGGYLTESIDEKVQLFEIERGLGWADPMRVPDPPGYAIALQIHMTNPYVQILFGLLPFGLAALIVSVPPGESDLTPGLLDPVLVVALAVAAFSSYYWIWRGVRRIRWWHAARAFGKARGERLPHGLRILI